MQIQQSYYLILTFKRGPRWFNLLTGFFRVAKSRESLPAKSKESILVCREVAEFKIKKELFKIIHEKDAVAMWFLRFSSAPQKIIRNYFVGTKPDWAVHGKWGLNGKTPFDILYLLIERESFLGFKPKYSPRIYVATV